MNIIKFFIKNIFLIMSVILIFCIIDQIYVMIRYKNITIETLFLTLCLAGINVYFGVSQIKKSKYLIAPAVSAKDFS